jgi:hypothetical protein
VHSGDVPRYSTGLLSFLACQNTLRQRVSRRSEPEGRRMGESCGKVFGWEPLSRGVTGSIEYEEHLCECDRCSSLSHKTTPSQKHRLHAFLSVSCVIWLFLFTDIEQRRMAPLLRFKGTHFPFDYAEYHGNHQNDSDDRTSGIKYRLKQRMIHTMGEYT